ncbi:hypothetical protein H0H87_011997 [Tephrocybe sp. NHM501043]|nr:hypothetical protein H0H87_011997 [Tephrocybe sp. NHM501043]
MAPTFAFPAPVLAVAADAVRELEGGEALTGLWTLLKAVFFDAVFTKCKASLKDGHRLENISWRLWYREMAINPRPGLVSESECEKEGPHRWLDEKAPLVREEQDTQPDVQFIPSTHAPLPAFRIPACRSIRSSLLITVPESFLTSTLDPASLPSSITATIHDQN